METGSVNSDRKEISPSLRKYLGIPEVALDYGTHEGAVKAAQTRKLHGGGVYNIDDEIIDHGMFDLGDEDHDTEHRGRYKTGGTNYEMADKSFPLSVRDMFLNYARGYKGDPKDVVTPDDLYNAGYSVSPGRRKGEIKLMQHQEPSLGNHWNAFRNLEYSWRPKHVPRAKPGTAQKKESAHKAPYLDMSGAMPTPSQFKHMVSRGSGEGKEVLLSDGSWTNVKKIRGNDVPYMTDKTSAENKAKEVGGNSDHWDTMGW